LTQDTTISITHTANAANSDVPISDDIKFLPEGLTFRQPATLTLKVPSSVKDASELNLFSISTLNPIVRAGTELTQMEPVTNYVFEASTSTLRVPVSHFSILSLLVERLKQEIVFDFSGKYLKKGDIIYVLTDATFWGVNLGLGWIPGHAALYLGTKVAESTDNDGTTVIESTSMDDTPDKHLGGQIDGVQFSDFEFVKTLKGNHLYMGARRPRPEPTDAERTAVAAFAIAKVNKVKYAKVGSSDTGISCVSLTETAYESIGRNIVPDLVELLPVRQFVATQPVDEITIKVGERFSMDVYGVVSRFGQGYGRASFSEYDMRVSAAPDSPAAAVLSNGRAIFQSSNTLIFTPSAEDADLAFVFRFTLDGTKSGRDSRSRPFLIRVEGKPVTTLVRQDPPSISIRTTSGNLNSTNLIMTATQALAIGPDFAGQVRLFWEPPPMQVTAGSAFAMRITAEATGVPTLKTTTSLPPLLQGQINDTVHLNRAENAVVGYELVGNCPPASSCDYQLTKRNLDKQTTVSATGPVITIDAKILRSSGLSSGEVTGTVTWTYKPVP
jgi:hypothetical protein